MSGAGEPSLPSLLAEVSELLRSSTLMENKRETIFELLRRSCLKSARDGALDSVSDAAAEDGWYFLLMIRRKSPVRKRRVDECLKALSSSQRWMQRLQTKKLQDFLAQDAESQKLLCGDTAGSNPFANAASAAPVCSPKAAAGTLVFSAAYEGAVGDQGPPKGEGEEGAELIRSTVSRRRSGKASPRQPKRAWSLSRNTTYGITEKIGSGAKTAYSKAREFDEKHQVTSKTASKNPFGAPQTARF
ncbi:unnamed protein product [Effrenium voratum]|uniref:Uncharacterized protein n=1 Tax=Effrenium voratum TaxID=2562239 RepID=A0AA36HRZ0_9DINO|nr:unnamed protein product [Effrenium voratum]